jgi:hypothetical protein
MKQFNRKELFTTTLEYYLVEFGELTEQTVAGPQRPPTNTGHFVCFGNHAAATQPCCTTPKLLQTGAIKYGSSSLSTSLGCTLSSLFDACLSSTVADNR